MDLDWSCSSTTTTTTGNPYCLLFQALSLIPISHYLLFSSFVFLSFLYRFLELHFLQDLFSLFSGSSVTLTYHPASQFYDAVVSKCRILHGTYLATPWLSSPHLQTVFLNFFGRPPLFKYRRSSLPTFLHSFSKCSVCAIVFALFDSSDCFACVMFLLQTTVYYSWWRNRCFGLALEFWRYYIFCFCFQDACMPNENYKIKRDSLNRMWESWDHLKFVISNQF